MTLSCSMGVSVFVCPVPTAQAFEEAARAIVTHNTTPAVRLGRRTDEEYARIDPKRAAVNKAMREALQQRAPDADGEPPAPFADGQDKFTRGEDIDTSRACLVQFRGQMWLEVTNGGGGACTTEFLQERFPECGWHGTDGKPNGFMDAPMLGPHGSLRDMKALHASRIA